MGTAGRCGRAEREGVARDGRRSAASIASDERLLRPSDERDQRGGDRGDQADDRERERVFRPEQRPDERGMSVRDQVLDVLLDCEATATRAARRHHALDEASRERPSGATAPRRATRRAVGGGACGARSRRRRRARSDEQEARHAPVPVAGRSERGDERLARADLREEDGVVRDEQRQSGQRPEGQPIPDVGRDRRGRHVSSYGAGTPSYVLVLRPTRRGREDARRGASAAAGAAAGRDRARIRCSPG